MMKKENMDFKVKIKKYPCLAFEGVYLSAFFIAVC